MGLLRSTLYILNNNQGMMFLLQLTNLSPAPLVFVSQSFFLKKNLTLKYEDNSILTYTIDEREEWITRERLLYTVIMYGNFLSIHDWNKIAEHFFCGKNRRLQFDKLREASPNSLELNYLEKNTDHIILKRNHVCKAH